MYYIPVMYNIVYDLTILQSQTICVYIYIYYACFLGGAVPGEPNCQPTMFGGFNNPCLVICAIAYHWLYQITIQITIQHLLYVYTVIYIYIRVFFKVIVGHLPKSQP